MDRKVRIILYGEVKDIVVKNDQPILTAAMEQGLEPPFSCQIGVCSTCRAILRSGEVMMDERDALTDEEIDTGFVLTCQSHPVTNNIVIDYDF